VREGIHPTWYEDARVICACGNTWTTGATQPEIRTDICSECHPFYTGQQRIVDTEGQVDRFMKRLQAREDRLAAREAEQEAGISPDLAITELEIGTRYEKALEEAGITVVGDILSLLEEEGDRGLTDIKGIGAKTLVDIKKELRSRGYELPE
jgi:large subunit ribosomal protein L31